MMDRVSQWKHRYKQIQKNHEVSFLTDSKKKAYFFETSAVTKDRWWANLMLYDWSISKESSNKEAVINTFSSVNPFLN